MARTGESQNDRWLYTRRKTWNPWVRMPRTWRPKNPWLQKPYNLWQRKSKRWCKGDDDHVNKENMDNKVNELEAKEPVCKKVMESMTLEAKEMMTMKTKRIWTIRPMNWRPRNPCAKKAWNLWHRKPRRWWPWKQRTKEVSEALGRPKTHLLRPRRLIPSNAINPIPMYSMSPRQRQRRYLRPWRPTFYISLIC